MVSSALGYWSACYTTESAELDMKTRVEYGREDSLSYTGLYQTTTEPKIPGWNFLLPGQNCNNIWQ